MKRQNTRTVVFVFLVCLSIFSYAYVNLADRQPSPVSSEDATEKVDELTKESEVKTAVNLPDVRMLRTVIEAGKRILPTSR